jgi:hypothetical protein
MDLCYCKMRTGNLLVINSTSSTKAASSESSFAIVPIIGGVIGGIVVLAGAAYVLMCRKSCKTRSNENSVEVSGSKLSKILITDSKKAGIHQQVRIHFDSTSSHLI